MKSSTIFKQCGLFVVRLALLALVLILLVRTVPVGAQGDSSLLFVENVGQFPDANTRFQVAMGQTTLTLANDALWLTVIEPLNSDGLNVETLDAQPSDVPPVQGVNLKLDFVDANPTPQLEPFNPLDTPISYFIGSNSAGWQGQVPVWGGVRYIDLYPGVDLELSGENGQFTPRLVIKDETGLDLLAGVRLRVEGADAISLDNAGTLWLTTAMGDISLPLLQLNELPPDQPLPIPQIDGQTVIAPFTTSPPLLSASAQVGIAATSDLIYSTFIGGNNYFDSSQDIVIDEAGHAYITGRAYAGFPSTPGVFDPTIEGFNDVFIAKLTPDGSALVYATFLGGSATESTYAIAIDETGNAYVCGYTGSSDFPVTPGAFDDSLATAQDSFVAKINSTGTALLYATYLGGNDDEWARDLAIDDEGHAFVTGTTRSTNFPTTPGALAPGYQGGFEDAFAVKLAADGSNLLYGTYLGGSEADSSRGVAVDSEGNAYFTGYTGSTDFPTTPGALDTTTTGADAYVIKLNPTGSALVYGTYLGGSQAEGGFAIALGNDGSAFVTGRTDSSDFPVTPDAFDTGFSFGGNDGFVARLSPAGDTLYYATYLGGNNEEEGRDVVVDEAGNAYITGATYASDFPVTSDAFDPTCPSCSPYLSAFIAKLNPNGTALIYGSYLGGETDHDQAYGLAQDGAGHVYISGDARSSDFPTTPGAFDTVPPNYYSKAFVSKLFIGTASAPPPPLLPEHSCGPELLDTFTVQSQPRGLAVDAARQRLYVANFGSSSVSVVDTRNDEVLQNIPDIEGANGVAYDPTQNIIWVSNTSTNQVTPIQANEDATSFTVLSPVDVGAGPWGVVYDPVHNYVVVANSLDSTVSVVDAAAQSLVVTLSGSFNQPFHLVANPVTGKVYVANFGQNSVTVVEGTSVNKVVQLWDSGRPYGIAVDELRDTVYVATVESNRIVAIGLLNGQPDQFLGWASFQRGYNPNRRVPLRAIAVNPPMGSAWDGGHVWATTSTGDGSEANQALLIPKGWSSGFHVPYVQNVGNNPTEGIAIDRSTNRVYVSSSSFSGLVTVLGDHSTLCNNVGVAGASPETDEVTFEVYSVENLVLSDVNSDGRVNIIDLTLVAARFGSNDPAVDLNGDGRVDILDITIVAGNYGQILPGSE